jgi:hypothetical protein
MKFKVKELFASTEKGAEKPLYAPQPPGMAGQASWAACESTCGKGTRIRSLTL